MIDDLPPLAEVVRRHGLFAKKSLGQNFLFDLNLTARIARAAGPLAGVTVVEIGPGPGGLTRALLAGGAEHVIAVERDARFRPALDEIAARWRGRLTIVEADAMTVDLGGLVPQGTRARVVANLPYNVATPILVRLVESEPWPPWFEKAVLMFQREVADRIVAGPERAAAYGRLAVLVGWRCRARLLFEVPARAFTPPPKVTSAVIEIEPRPAPAPCSVGALSRVTLAAFGQRRKMLRQSLRSVFAEPIGALEAVGIAPTRRAEEVPIEGFVALANAAGESGAGLVPPG